MSLDDLLTARCTIVRQAQSGPVDDWNNPTPGAPADVATVDCSVQDRAGREVPNLDGSGTIISDVLLFLPWGTDVTEGDTIRQEADALLGTAARSFDVLHVKDVAGRGAFLEVDGRFRRVPGPTT